MTDFQVFFLSFGTRDSGSWYRLFSEDLVFLVSCYIGNQALRVEANSGFVHCVDMSYVLQ